MRFPRRSRSEPKTTELVEGIGTLLAIAFAVALAVEIAMYLSGR